jgi:hypothetical protein
MIYQFQMTSRENKSFKLEIKTSTQHTFFDLHSIIQKSLGYESHQLASFFISDRKGMKEKEISMLDMGLNGGAYYIMQKTLITDFVTKQGQRLIYTFDFLNDRSLSIELMEIIMEKNLFEPLVSLKLGDSPVQVLGEEFEEVDLENSETEDEKVLSYFGELEDYTEIFGDMEDF